jgi:HlyD family secretion protein
MNNLTVKPDLSTEQSNIRILVVDDQNLIRQKLRLSIESQPDLQVVGVAEDGQTAIEQIEALRPDIALVDIEMPGMNGLTTTEIIARRFSDTKVLVLSGYDEEDYIKNALKVGAKGYLLKNTPTDEIVHAIRYVDKGYLQLGPGLFEKLETQTSEIAETENEQSVTPQRSQPTNPQPTTSPGQLTSSNRDRDWSFLTKELVDTLPRVWTRGLLYFLVVFLAILLPWSMLSKVDETGNARGRLEPKGNTIKLDAPVAGKVTAIKIKEGQQVKTGQTLIELDSKTIRNSLRENQTKFYGLLNQLSNFQLMKERLEINTKTQKQQNQATISEQLALIDQIRQKSNFYRSQIDSANQLVTKDRDFVTRYRKFQQQGVVSGNQLDEVERRLIQNNQTLEQARSDKTQQQTELTKQHSNYEKIIHQGELAVIETNKQLQQTQSQIINTRSEIAQTKEQIKSLQYQLEQSQLLAPTNGTIFQLSVGHPGAVLQAGNTVTRIAPKGLPLVLKARMPVTDSGFLRVNMPVKIKFDAYPFQDYGIVSGRVTWVSPDSKGSQSEQGQQPSQPQPETFELEIKLDSNYIETKNKRITLTPGQTATAEVIVRQRRLIDFVLDPFKKLQKGGLDL